MTALLTVQAVMTVLVLAIVGYLIARAPHNVPLRALAIAGGAFTATVMFHTAATHGLTVAGLTPITSRLIHYLGMTIGGYNLLAFYLYTALPPEVARRRLRWQALPCGIAVVVTIAAMVVMPAAVQADAAAQTFTHLSTATPTARVTVAVFTATPNFYVACAYLAALTFTRRTAHGAEPRLRRGLLITATGLTALILGESLLVILAIALGAGVLLPGWWLTLALAAIVPGSVLFMAGITYPAVRTRLAALRVWRHHYRTYHELGPLWTLLHQQFPQDALDRVPTSRWRDMLNLRGVHRRYYRRVIECRDGLVRLSPYLPTTTSTSIDPAVLAHHIRDGLHARATSTLTPHRAIPIAIPTTDDLDADAHTLTALADALRRH